MTADEPYARIAHETMRANKALILAAPALAEALRDIEQETIKVPDGELREALFIIRKLARAALALSAPAEGGGT